MSEREKMGGREIEKLVGGAVEKETRGGGVQED